MSTQFYVGFGLVILWNILFWSIFPAKISVDGFYETFGFFTNWTFAETGLYFTLELAGYIYSFFTTNNNWKSYQHCIRMCLIWAVLGANFLVFFMVFVLMVENWEMMNALTTEGGGTYTLGEVVDLEKVFHTLPTLFVVYFMLIVRDEIEESIHPIKNMIATEGEAHLGWLLVGLQVFSGTVLMLLFEGVLGFNNVYDAHVSIWIGFLFVIVIICTSVLPMYILLLNRPVKKIKN